jgi:putative ATP-dependent endonuclease of OLD family
MFLRRVDVQGYRAAAEMPLTCEFPGRFSLLLGANGAGKTTLNEAIVHAHRHRFPRFPQMDAAVLGPPPRAVGVEYEYEIDPDEEGALGRALRRSGHSAPRWSRPLERSLGRVRAGSLVDATEGHDSVRLIYLPALRNPVDELSRRDAQILLELLRAEQLRNPSSGGLGGLRARAESMLSSLSAQQLVVDVQGRIAENLRTISGGVHEHHAFIGTQQVDDSYLARVFEILLATLPDPTQAKRLEASSLGYVNLLHIAVTLAGIPEPALSASGAASVAEDWRVENMQQANLDDGEATSQARERLEQASASADEDQDSFFPDLFHATVLIEEPEAHLHPQLQYGLVRYLRRVTAERPDVQVIVTTHSGELTSACDPDELVVVRRNLAGAPVARSLRSLPLPLVKKANLFQQTRLHLDANRSGSLFGDRVLIVEGVTEAVLMRVLGRSWAEGDVNKGAFIDSLAIFPVGHKIGEWPMRILATTGFELVTRIAALSDTDLRGDPLPLPTPPTWHSELDPNVARFFWSRPTLEPSLITGNESFVEEALANLNLSLPSSPTPELIDQLFRGTAKRRKGEFALEVASVMEDAPQSIVIPDHIRRLFNWLHETPERASAEAAETAG